MVAMINLPDGAVKYIKAQRSSLQRARLATNKHQIEQWTKSCGDEVAWILENFPVGDTLLDIGCGLGGAGVLLAPSLKHIYMLDGTGWDDTRAGFKKETKPWNSLDVTREVMALNGLTDKTTLIDYRERPDIKVDTVISITSWCYHYPVGEYIDWVRDIINPGGHLYVDIRFSDIYFSEIDKIVDAGFTLTKARNLIYWGGRWKGVRHVYTKD